VNLVGMCVARRIAIIILALTYRHCWALPGPLKPFCALFFARNYLREPSDSSLAPALPFCVCLSKLLQSAPLKPFCVLFLRNSRNPPILPCACTTFLEAAASKCWRQRCSVEETLMLLMLYGWINLATVTSNQTY